MNSPKKDHIVLSYFKYGIAGSIAVGVNYIVLSLLVELFGVNPTLSSGIGFLTGVLVNYNLQYYFTFRSKHRHRHIFPKYLLVVILSLSLNVAIFWVLTVPLGIWYIYSQAIALICVSFVTFTINRRLIFL